MNRHQDDSPSFEVHAFSASFGGLTASSHLGAARLLPGPYWDVELRELYFDGILVKQFSRTAPNQELILSAFQEQNWTRRIDDPLPPLPGRDPAERLHDTIRHLNSGLRTNLIRFRRDGTGQGVRWTSG